MKKHNGITIIFRIFINTFCVLLLLSPFIFIAGTTLADASISINTPSAGGAIGPGPFDISVSFSMDSPGRYMVYASWYDASIGGGGQSFQQEVSGSSGSVTFYADATGYPSGRYRVIANIVNAEFIPAAPVLASTQTDFFIDVNIGSVPATTPGGSSSGSNGGAVAAIAAGIVAVVGGSIWLIRKMSGGGKTGPVKKAPGPKVTYKEAETVEEAARRLAEVKRNGALMDRYHRLRQIVWNDDRLLDFVDNARNSVIGKDGQINEANLYRLENNLKYWIQRDTLGVKMPEYGGTDVMIDFLKAPVTGWTGILVRGTAAFFTVGYSEMVFNPLSSLLTMRDSINEDKSTFRAVVDGYKTSVTHLALGESGRLVKYAKPYYDAWKKSRAISSFNQANPDIAAELSTIEQLAKQGQTTRDAFMKSTEVVKIGETAATELTHAEKLAIELANNPVARKALAERSDLISARVKEVMGVAKQKVYENARNEAAEEVMKQMAKDGINTAENPFFIRQTGTHAQPGNPGWNSLKSDFDHTVEFGSSKYNQLYEQKFNTSLKAQGTNATAMDANVYQGTTGPGAYEGGAIKFVDYYNQTSGSDIMIRNVKGVTNITRETPQASTSLLSTMNKADVQSAGANYQKFFVKDMAKGGSLDNQIANGSKTVSRNAGQYSTKYVENFQNTGKVNYQPPDAAKVADLIKKRGFSVDDAMKKVGYNGSKEQLLSDFKKIMGVP